MKKLFILIMAAALFLAVGCSDYLRRLEGPGIIVTCQDKVEGLKISVFKQEVLLNDYLASSDLRANGAREHLGELRRQLQKEEAECRQSIKK